MTVKELIEASPSKRRDGMTLYWLFSRSLLKAERVRFTKEDAK